MGAVLIYVLQWASGAAYWGSRPVRMAAAVSMESDGGGRRATAGPPKVTIGGRSPGLAGSGLVLQNNGGDDLGVSSATVRSRSQQVSTRGAIQHNGAHAAGEPIANLHGREPAGTSTANVTNVTVSAAPAPSVSAARYPVSQAAGWSCVTMAATICRSRRTAASRLPPSSRAAARTRWQSNATDVSVADLHSCGCVGTIGGDDVRTVKSRARPTSTRSAVR